MIRLWNWSLFGLVALFLLTLGQTAAKGEKGAKEMCITFDELPASESFGEVDKAAISSKILTALRKHEAKAAGFVVGANIGNGYDLLGQWLNDGHILGNLTYSELDLNETGIEQFIKNIELGNETLEPMLSGFGQDKCYFRYPYLHYGSSAEAKRQVKLYLDDQDIVIAHATIIVEDYLYNLSFEKLGEKPDSAKYVTLRYEYITHVLAQVERCEALAAELLNRRCRHILLLRANSLNAEFLDDLLTALRDKGYKFVSLDYALMDELYTIKEAYLGLRGFGYLDMLRLSDPDLLPAE